jgi:hypothetical protein
MRIINMACRRRKEAHLRVDQYRSVATAQLHPDDPLCAVSQARGLAGCFWRLRDFCIKQADHFIYLFHFGVCVVDFPPRANLGAQVTVSCGAPRGRTLQ